MRVIGETRGPRGALLLPSSSVLDRALRDTRALLRSALAGNQAVALGLISLSRRWAAAVDPRAAAVYTTIFL